MTTTTTAPTLAERGAAAAAIANAGLWLEPERAAPAPLLADLLAAGLNHGRWGSAAAALLARLEVLETLAHLRGESDRARVSHDTLRGARAREAAREAAPVRGREMLEAADLICWAARLQAACYGLEAAEGAAQWGLRLISQPAPMRGAVLPVLARQALEAGAAALAEVEAREENDEETRARRGDLISQRASLERAADAYRLGRAAERDALA